MYNSFLSAIAMSYEKISTCTWDIHIPLGSRVGALYTHVKLYTLYNSIVNSEELTIDCCYFAWNLCFNCYTLV